MQEESKTGKDTDFPEQDNQTEEMSFLNQYFVNSRLI